MSAYSVPKNSPGSAVLAPVVSSVVVVVFVVVVVVELVGLELSLELVSSVVVCCWS